MNTKNNLIVSIIILAVVVLAFYLILKSNKNMQTPQNEAVSQLQISVLKEGSGPGAKSGDRVSVNYTGTFTDGRKFDSNTDPAFGHVSPFQFVLGAGQVIAGWDQGVAGMKVGEIRKLVIPPHLGYGQNTVGSIPGGSTLIFEVEMLEIK
jgi:FKBP-type peptidyl-prolyl cis-trans isomerase